MWTCSPSPGATDSIRKYFLQSQAAEAGANASTIDPGSPVETSSELRRLTEDKMNQTREEFLAKHGEHAQRLDDLAGELQTLDLSEISQKVGEEPHAADLTFTSWTPSQHPPFLLPAGLRQSSIGPGLVLVLPLWRSGLRGL